MINKLKSRFIILSAVSILILLTIIVSGMNIINYNTVVTESDGILALISGNKGQFPDFKDTSSLPQKPEDSDFGQFPQRPEGERFPHNMSPELPYESRYFSVLFDKNGKVMQTDISKIAAIDNSEAEKLAKSAKNSSKAKGFISSFRYAKRNEGELIRITFLDCGRKLDAYKAFLISSIIMAAAGFGLVLVVIIIISDRIVKPIAEAHQKQKQFITDAGHEIKTPLTIISADADVLGLDIGENEYLADIKLQTKKLAELTNDLVYLSKMEEAESALQKIDIPLSEIVSETVNSFGAVALNLGKTISAEITPLITLCGNPSAIEQLVGILLENALKYSPEGSSVSVSLTRSGRHIELTVLNSTDKELSEEDLARIFDRFYRPDASRNSSTGGHGIGLSVAKAIVEAHSGKLSAFRKERGIFGITASLG